MGNNTSFKRTNKENVGVLMGNTYPLDYPLGKKGVLGRVQTLV